MRIFPIFKRPASGSQGGGEGDVDARFNVKSGLRFGTALENLLGYAVAGVRAAVAPVYAVAAQRPALRIGAPTASGAVANAVQRPALRMSSRQGGAPLVSDRPAFDILQTVITLDGAYGANSSGVVGASVWQNVANAQSRHDGSYATAQGPVGGSNSTLTLSYADFVGKTGLAISVVQVRLYWRQSGTVLGNGNFKAEYSLNNGTTWTTLATRTGDFDVAPETFDITTAVGGDWSKLNGLQVRFTLVTPVGGTTIAVGVDAAEVAVTASRTELN